MKDPQVIWGYPVLARAAFETARICLPTVLEARRGVLRQEDCDARLRSWAARVLEHVDAKLVVSGAEHLKEAPGPFVVVGNHQSYFDIPVMYAALPLPLRMAAKAELFEIPLWGPALRAANFVRIDRKHPDRAHEALREAGERMRQSGTSLFVAPEGTRSADGSLGPFKSGAFRMAEVMGFPIVPVAISGTYGIHRKDGAHVGRGCEVKVRILAPLLRGENTTPEAWAELARAKIKEALLELEGPDPHHRSSAHVSSEPLTLK